MDNSTAQKIDMQTAENIRKAVNKMSQKPEYFNIWFDALFRHVIRERCRLRGSHTAAEDLYRAADAAVADLPFEPFILRKSSRIDKKRQPVRFFKDHVFYSICAVFFLGCICGALL